MYGAYTSTLSDAESGEDKTWCGSCSDSTGLTCMSCFMPEHFVPDESEKPIYDLKVPQVPQVPQAPRHCPSETPPESPPYLSLYDAPPEPVDPEKSHESSSDAESDPVERRAPRYYALICYIFLIALFVLFAVARVFKLMDHSHCMTCCYYYQTRVVNYCDSTPPLTPLIMCSCR